MPDHDAIVVGAGPVGLLAACLLAQRGLDVLVCERHEGADERTRAIGIHPPGLAALDAVGIGREVREEALALRGGDVFSRGRMLASVDFAEGRRVLTLPQPRTSALLRRRLEQLGAASLRPGCAAVSARDEGAFVRLTAEQHGVRRELTASWLLVADGVRSPLRTQLGRDWRPQRGAATYAMVDVPDAAAGDRALLHCEPGGLVEAFPLPGGVRRWVARVRAGAPLHEREAFRTAIRERIGMNVRMPREVEPVVFRAAQHRTVSAIEGRIVLLGDAAHEISPIGGQGMNLGWMEATRIAGALGGSPQDLHAVARRNAQSTARVQRRARFYMSMGAPADGIRLRVRETLISLLAAPPIRQGTAELITMGRV